MKKIYLVFITLSLLFIALSCDKDLPYPIDEVKKGVVIDVSRVAGTDGLLSNGLTTGNYKINLTIPEQQGDYSFMKHAQLLAVFQDAAGKLTSKVVKDNITEFPAEIVLNIADVYQKFGLTSPALGETVYFTTNTVMKDDFVIPGWDKVIGFNNKAFSGWRVNGRGYTYNVRYAVACFLDEDPVSGTFIGKFTMDEKTPYGDDSYEVTLSHNPNPPAAGDIPIGVSADELYGIDISPFSPNIWEPTIEVITIWINTADHSLVMPNQDTGDTNGGRKVFWDTFKDGSISSCNSTIEFTVRPYMPGYGGWNFFTFKIHR